MSDDDEEEQCVPVPDGSQLRKNESFHSFLGFEDELEHRDWEEPPTSAGQSSNDANNGLIAENSSLFGDVLPQNKHSRPEIVRIAKILLQQPVVKSNMYSNVDELLSRYERWKVGTDITEDIKKEFHDLVKRACSFGSKKNLDYKRDELVGYILEEQRNLLRIRNKMRHILDYTPATGNKRLVLDLLAHLENREVYQTGGGASPLVQRIVFMFHQESNIRKSTRSRGEASTLAVSITDSRVSEMSTVNSSSNSCPPAKRRQVQK